MSAEERRRGQRVSVSASYGLARALVRLGLNFFYPKIRLIHSEGMAAAQAPLLVLNHPPSFLDALILLAACEGSVRCMIPRRLVRGAWRGLIAKSLGMIAYQEEGKSFKAALDRCLEILAGHEPVVVLAGVNPDQETALGRVASSLALEAETPHAGEFELTIFPVHLSRPAARSGEALIYIDAPIDPREFKGGDAAAASRALAERIARACRDNAFRLEPQGIRHFLSGFEEVLRTDLAEEWAARPHWKQSVEGFELSRFVTDWAVRINHLDPGELVAVVEALDEYREARRRRALVELEIEAGGKWLSSVAGRAIIWLETALGFPLALYGLGNHLLLILFHSLFGLPGWPGLPHTERSSRSGWLRRALLWLGVYAGQALLCARLLGRSAAGYYALSLLPAGAYLGRYRWLLAHRTRLALARLRIPGQDAKLGRRRKKLIAHLDRAMRDRAPMARTDQTAAATR